MSILVRKPTSPVLDATQWAFPNKSITAGTSIGTIPMGGPTTIIKRTNALNAKTPDSRYKTVDSGNYQTRETPNEFKLTEERPMPNMRPVVDMLNFGLAHRSINKTLKEQLARKNMYLPTQSLSVRPVQDLSPEILAAQDAARSQVRSEYAGSDPAMNLISKNVASANRGKMYNEQIAGRAQQLMGERARHDQETRQNQQMAGETEAKNIQLAQDYADYRTGAKTAAIDARNKLNSSFLSQLGMNIDTVAQYNLQAKAQDTSNARATYNDMLKEAYLEGTPYSERIDKLRLAKEFWAPYAAQTIPTYGQAQASAISRKWMPKFLQTRTVQ